MNVSTNPCNYYLEFFVGDLEDLSGKISTKFKVGHKRPFWKDFSYNYPDQEDYRTRVICILEDTLARLKGEVK